MDKKLFRIISVILFMLFMSGIVESGERYTKYHRDAVLRIDILRLENKIHILINKERRKKGLAILSWDENLHRIARKHSENMVHRNFFSHNDPEGRCFYDRYKEDGFKCNIPMGDTTCLGAENISQDNIMGSLLYRSRKNLSDMTEEDRIAGSVVDRWMKSKGHRENILKPYFKRQGIGVSLSDDGKVYVTENFC